MALLWKRTREANQLRMKSIAVLPFNPFGRSFDDTFFADGMHDDILTQLSKISGLRVIARTSMVLYRDSKKTPRQIGNELDVGYVLEGGTRRAGGKIRITAQLIRTADEGHAWSDTYDRNDADVFAVQSDIAQRTASSMEAVLSPAEKASVEEIPTTSKRAYDCYLQGNYDWGYIDSAGNAKAAELYEKAAEIDSTFVQAYARSAAANGAVYSIWDRKPARYATMVSALEKARALNPEDPVVHWAQGRYLAYSDTVRGLTERLTMALEEFQKALKTRPNWADLHRDTGDVLWREGLLTEARESIRRHFSLSPMSLASGWGPWTISSWLREWDVARKEIDEYIARRPDDLEGYSDKERILIDGFGDLEGARAVFDYPLSLPYFATVPLGPRGSGIVHAREGSP
jgi:TolB-like protein